MPFPMDDFGDLHAGHGGFAPSTDDTPMMISPPISNEGGTIASHLSSESRGHGEDDQVFRSLSPRGVDDGNGPTAQTAPINPIFSPRCEVQVNDYCLQQEKPHHCRCSRAALDALDQLGGPRDGAGYARCLEAVQLAFRTAEELVLCTTCAPGLVIAKSCLLLGSAYEVLSDVSIGGETPSRTRVQADFRRVQRRATMLFAGLRALQDLDAAASPNLAAVRAEFLAGLAKSWSTLPEP
ncbi:hypothetical protein SLS58_006549 [Diplodia intermedia]|uniref:Uncharacterized protein n=1 Tax=Diplodia intermedia TaxID=856260 RepID=A0ABR3TN59_9PEZI